MDADAFLARVRSGLAGVAPAPLPDVHPQTPASGDGRLFDRFAEELEKAGGTARWVSRQDLSAEVYEAAVEASASTAVVSDDVAEFRERIDRGLADAGCAAAPVSREAAASADLGVTGGVVGVCSTGSVLLRATPASPRIASLLPPAHVAILHEAALVPGFEELFDVLGEQLREANAAVLVTGPSRTTDIELQLVRGVHGPKSMTALVVREE
ncbi:MAG TPA: LUD domain-containing protein [Actinomycetota bacterium]|nr:LUD domain-containing protein [Actinomycetota bacterium]